MNRRRVLIVDDEPLARKAMSLVLAEFPEIEVIGECADGFEAVKMINQEKPEVVFLDIQMPKLDGFDVLELLEDPPFIVFVLLSGCFKLLPLSLIVIIAFLLWTFRC